MLDWSHYKQCDETSKAGKGTKYRREREIFRGKVW